MSTCGHAEVRAREIGTDKLERRCEACGATCSETQIGDDDLCYDQYCPLHVMAGEIRAVRS